MVYLKEEYILGPHSITKKALNKILAPKCVQVILNNINFWPQLTTQFVPTTNKFLIILILIIKLFLYEESMMILKEKLTIIAVRVFGG